MSHYQQYLKAIQSKEKSPSPISSIPRKPANTTYAPVTPTSSSPSPARQRSLGDNMKSETHTPASTAPPSAPVTPASTAPSKQHSLPSHPSPAVASAHNATTTSAPVMSSSLTKTQIDNALHIALTLQIEATSQHSKRPFAAILLGPDDSTVLLTHFSISHVRHAESELARLASDHFSISYLSSCTLVTTWEPCAMCSGTTYWSGIGRVVYAASEAKLKELTGPDNDENMTMSMPCRKVFEAGQRQVEVIGPIPEWEEKVVNESKKWWKEHNGTEASVKSNSSLKNGFGHGQGERGSIVTTWTGEETVLSSIGEDGEYTADLDIDWMR